MPPRLAHSPHCRPAACGTAACMNKLKATLSTRFTHACPTPSSRARCSREWRHEKEETWQEQVKRKKKGAKTKFAVCGEGERGSEWFGTGSSALVVWSSHGGGGGRLTATATMKSKASAHRLLRPFTTTESSSSIHPRSLHTRSARGARVPVSVEAGAGSHKKTRLRRERMLSGHRQNSLMRGIVSQSCPYACAR